MGEDPRPRRPVVYQLDGNHDIQRRLFHGARRDEWLAFLRAHGIDTVPAADIGQRCTGPMTSA